jgi:hypothetical protein
MFLSSKTLLKAFEFTRVKADRGKKGKGTELEQKGTEKVSLD